MIVNLPQIVKKINNSNNYNNDVKLNTLLYKVINLQFYSALKNLGKESNKITKIQNQIS